MIATPPPGADGFVPLRLPDSTDIACLFQGQGRLLLMIHGSLCDGRYWGPQMRALSNQRQVCSPSLRHYHPLPGRGPLDWRRDVADMLALIDLLSPGEAVDVIGHSRGGAIAYQLARQAPGRIRRLVLAEPGGDMAGSQPGSTGADPRSADWEQALREQLERGEIESAVAAFIDAVSRPGTWANSPASFRQMALDNAQTLFSRADDKLPAYEPDEAAGMALPVLLVKGQRSRASFRQTVDALAQALPQAQTLEIAGASHGMNLAHPRAFNQAVQAFLQDA